MPRTGFGALNFHHSQPDERCSDCVRKTEHGEPSTTLCPVWFGGVNIRVQRAAANLLTYWLDYVLLGDHEFRKKLSKDIPTRYPGGSTEKNHQHPQRYR